jgi:hypothetical protein
MEILINHKPYNIPTTWSEVSLKQFSDMMNYPKADSARLLSIISGIDYHELINYDLTQFDLKVLDHLEFIHQEPNLFVKWQHRKVKVCDRFVESPKDIEVKTWYQRSMLKQAVDKHSKLTDEIKNKDFPSLVCEALTIYLQPMLLGDKVDSEYYDQVREMVWQMNVEDCYQMAGFFLRHYIVFELKRQEN